VSGAQIAALPANVNSQVKTKHKDTRHLDTPGQFCILSCLPPSSGTSYACFDRFATRRKCRCAGSSQAARRRDPIFIDGERPRPLFVDYKDLELLNKLTNRQGKIVSRRKSGCTAASQHAVTLAIKRARFMALLPYVGE
jgi:small subunit ribosomal protein S18